MNLYDLKQNIANMTQEQLTSMLHDVRSSRRISKKAITAKKVIEKADTTKIMGAVAGLSKEDKAALLADLLEKM